jgi:ABC-type multidrug transport system ATPase subunit
VKLQVQALTRRFGGRVVLGPLDLALDGGERLALTGPNGAGKSTLLRCVAGSVAPSSGTVTIDGADAGSRAARMLTGTSLAQERSFYLRLSGLANLLTFARLRMSTVRARAAVRELIAELELEEIAARRVDRCSTGMVQQLAFARALLGTPSLLLLDEPTRSLDDGAVGRLWQAIERRPETAVVIATHRGEDAERCERHLALACD